MTITLDSNDASQVSSASVLESLLGDPQRHLLIFTGIPIVSFGSQDDNMNRTTVDVNLRRTLSRKPLANEWSAVVGLASIISTDEEFITATDDVSIDFDQNTKELHLICNIAVQGDYASLLRFSYQVNVLVEEVVPQLQALLVSDLQSVGGLENPGQAGTPAGDPVYNTSTTVVGGKQWGGRVILTIPAPAQGAEVHLSSNPGGIADVQVSVPVPPGFTTAPFTSTSPTVVVTKNTDVLIMASLNGSQKTAVVTVLAPPQ